VIMERIPWREARRAQEVLDQGAVQGKLVLTFPSITAGVWPAACAPDQSPMPATSQLSPVPSFQDWQ
jgi:hypothetical protein